MNFCVEISLRAYVSHITPHISISQTVRIKINIWKKQSIEVEFMIFFYFGQFYSICPFTQFSPLYSSRENKNDIFCFFLKKIVLKSKFFDMTKLTKKWNSLRKIVAKLFSRCFTVKFLNIVKWSRNRKNSENAESNLVLKVLYR